MPPLPDRSGTRYHPAAAAQAGRVPDHSQPGRAPRRASASAQFRDWQHAIVILDRGHSYRAEKDWPMSTYQQIASSAGHVPPGLWITLIFANIAVTIVTWGRARRQLRWAGERAVHPDRFPYRARNKDTALTVASLVPAALFWGMVLAGSFRGLVAFGRTVLDWNGGAQYLVPGTLDGISVTFAFLAFRAIYKQKDPTRCYRVVWAASLSSATVNFAYEYSATDHNVIAGGYLGLLSVFGMVIFHEFLSQFEQGAEYVRRAKRPSYGLRWLTWPSSTFCAFIAWENFPPAEGTPATVLNGLANLERVRRIKRIAADDQVADRHVRNLAAARRTAELATATAGQIVAGDARTTDDVAVLTAVPAQPRKPVATPNSVPVTARTARIVDGRTDEPTSVDVRVPATAATVADWVHTWMRISADGDACGPLNDDDHARTVYNLSAKQLGNIRNAAISGALARRATELGVALPYGYIDCDSESINGPDLAHIAA
jgi:Protein of unknown function (DUF2637)